LLLLVCLAVRLALLALWLAHRSALLVWLLVVRLAPKLE
jgi:hypothetical protein